MAYNLLAGKKGIIFGALDENSIAWKIALKAKEEGASFTLTNAPIALRMGKINELAEQCDARVIPADVTVLEDIEKLYRDTQEALETEQIDFILHSVGMSPNVRKGRDYGNLNYDWFMKTLDISGVSFHKVLQTAENMGIMNEWGSIVALTYIAAQRTFPDYGDMAQAKAVLESIARSYGYRFGRLNKVRVNTVSQSPTRTTAGTGINGFDVFFDYADKMSALGNADAESCADFVVTLFSDLTRMVTMQNLMHDGGFSSAGISEDIIDELSR
ncbi:MAG: SDR family oxidoreductase [Tunicatimonas sp.]